MGDAVGRRPVRRWFPGSQAEILVVATDDTQAGLAVLLVPYVALPLAAVTAVVRTVVRARDAAAPSRGLVPDRLAALAVDVAVAGAALLVPLRALAGAGHEVAAVAVGVLAGTAYLAVPVALGGRGPGHALLRLRVVDARSGGPVGAARAVARSAAVVVEVMAAPTIVLAVPALADLAAASSTGRSLVDRLLGTAVVRDRLRACLDRHITG